MKTAQTIYRQGDVLLRRIAQLPADATRVDTQGQNVVLALGEATGHKHQFQFSDAEIYRTAGGAQLVHVLRDGAPLLHEEHSAAEMPQGFYERIEQVEYSPAELRAVAD
jgi:xanthine dehydrogenase molybdopterin-binding subunit B